METNVHQMIANQDLNFITKSYVAFQNFSYKGMQSLSLCYVCIVESQTWGVGIV